MKKTVFLAVALFALMAVGAFAQEYNSESDFKVTITKAKDAVTITKYSGKAAAVNIPPTIQNVPVTSIGKNAFKDNKIVTGVTIPNSVTGIGDTAFSGCVKLADVTIGSGVTSMGKGIFDGCTSLTGMTVDSDNPSYVSEGNILYNKAKTTIVYVPNNISGNVTIADSVTFIGDSAFEKRTGLTGITIPDSVTTIGRKAFAGCTGLTSVTIPDSVTGIMDNAFNGCKNLISLTVGKGLTGIGINAFLFCLKLENVTFQGNNRNITGLNSATLRGDLADKYATYGTGTYTSPPLGDRDGGIWTKQGSAVAAAPQNTGTASNQSVLNQAAAAMQQKVADEIAAEQSKTRRSGNNPLEGTTWIQTDGKGYQVLSFHGPLNIGNNNAPVVILQWGADINTGTYTVSGDKVTISIGNRTGTISGNVITFSAWTFTQYGGPMPSVGAQSGGGPLVGTTWKQSDGEDNDEIVFSGPSIVIWVENPHSRTPQRFRGTYTVSGNKVTVTFQDIYPYPLVAVGTISGNTLSLREYDEDDGSLSDRAIPFTKQ